jgi:hypothetical protein
MERHSGFGPISDSDEAASRSLADLRAPGRTEGVRKIAVRHGVSVGTVQRISRPFEDGEELSAA